MKKYSLIIERFKYLPFLQEHIILVKTLLKKEKRVLIALKEADNTEENLCTFYKRFKKLYKIFKKELKKGTIKIIEFPEIDKKIYVEKREVKNEKNKN